MRSRRALARSIIYFHAARRTIVNRNFSLSLCRARVEQDGRFAREGVGSQVKGAFKAARLIREMRARR